MAIVCLAMSQMHNWLIPEGTGSIPRNILKFIVPSNIGLLTLSSAKLHLGNATSFVLSKALFLRLNYSDIVRKRCGQCHRVRELGIRRDGIYKGELRNGLLWRNAYLRSFCDEAQFRPGNTLLFFPSRPPLIPFSVAFGGQPLMTISEIDSLEFLSGDMETSYYEVRNKLVFS